ncbi:transporter substrate-binding domain-containing protein [Acerihabitans sp. KWT182]|uniref:Transporter substrate-binding domain-containing protein n=1 Tax=Acerihabitans sp. KWT182 TaxID=3157919 RepID=A0AAU7Q5T0_9GAMM
MYLNRRRGFFFGMAPAGRADTLPPLPKYIADQGKLRVGVKCDYQPAGFLGSDGKPTGIEVDMARHIAQVAFGSPDKIELQCVTSENRIAALMGRKIDLILATLGIFPERQKVIDFTTPYFWGSSSFLVLKNSPYQNNADILDKQIIVLKGASQNNWLAKKRAEGGTDTHEQQRRRAAKPAPGAWGGVHRRYRLTDYPGAGQSRCAHAAHKPTI